MVSSVKHDRVREIQISDVEIGDEQSWHIGIGDELDALPSLQRERLLRLFFDRVGVPSLDPPVTVNDSRHDSWGRWP